MGLFGRSENKQQKSEIVEDGKMLLRKEELDIGKSRVQTGEVTLSKEIVQEQKVVDVPVTHEEVIIERRAVNNEPSDSTVTAEGVIHIPVSKEEVHVDKHTVVTGEVSAYKHAVEETQRVDEALKREEVRVNTKGDPNIIADKGDGHLH